MCEEDVSLYGQYGECRFLRVLEAGEGNNTADAALALCEFPGETADNAASVSYTHLSLGNSMRMSYSRPSRSIVAGEVPDTMLYTVPTTC